MAIALVPGAPEQSQVWARMNVRDFDSMPVGTESVDADAVELVRRWLAGL